ncbi:MAG: hypothetical protein JSR09_00435 [Bacteroidetes bacterium]|nr:hypothetical protein [Bacteroidota bacterium]MBS1648151.1 hypothetical protein [Bacteroidota bacterium]
MKFGLLLFFTFFLVANCFSQHCPWDCKGIVVLSWESSYKFNNYNILLVNEKHDPVYLLTTNDSIVSKFELYSWWKERQKNIIIKDPSAVYDTAYHFVENKIITLFNWCSYQSEKLFVQITSTTTPIKHYYIPITDKQKIHLHNTQLWKNKNASEFDKRYVVRIQF